MLRKFSIFIEKFWSNYFPSRQLLLKTGSETKFFTLSSSTQAIIIFAVFIFVGWSLFSSLIFTFKALNLGVNKEYFARSNVNYEDRIEQISDEKYSYFQVPLFCKYDLVSDNFFNLLLNKLII